MTLALGAVLCGLLSTPARAQLEDGATISTEGTQFVEPERQEPPPQSPPPPAPLPQTAPPPVAAPLPPSPPPAKPPRFPTVVILLDTSDSMLNPIQGTGHTRLGEAKSALEHVLSEMSAETRVQIWTFNTRMSPVRIDRTPPGQFITLGERNNRQALIQKVRGIRTAGGTNLYQSVVRALGLFGGPAQQSLYRSGQRYPSLVVISDGEDSGKTPETLATVEEAKQKQPLVTVNTIGFRVSRQEPWFAVLCQIATRKTGCGTAGNEQQLQRILDSFHRPPVTGEPPLSALP